MDVDLCVAAGQLDHSFPLMAAVEHDGVEWHSSPDQIEHDLKRRQEAREEGWLIEPLTGANVFGRHPPC